MNGTVDRIIYQSGFGFIRSKDGMQFFFEHSDVECVDFSALQEGDEVDFEMLPTKLGVRAVRVTRQPRQHLVTSTDATSGQQQTNRPGWYSLAGRRIIRTGPES